MSRPTIDYGIDLGTTNSTIARLNGVAVEVFRNAEGFEYTPSAVWIDKQGKLVVGRIAKEWCEREPDNAFMEFKRHMGGRHEFAFARSGRKMSPEALSAEVLKCLRADAERRGDSITSAVITVPADFTLDQCEATKRAANLAGLEHSLLLTEPVSAAQAYGFEREDEKTFWLVYDFGGGTFDAAIIQVRDGLIQTVGSGGDNELGGKNIDWAIVEQLFIPALHGRALTGFARGSAKWNGAIAKLKIQAEAAKMRLSAADATDVAIDFLCTDDRGDPVEFNYELRRADLERLAAPFIRRSINICKETLESRRLAPGHIAKIIMVGGPTLMPFLREQLSDASEGLGIPLECDVDPLTVVARGAAVFAGSQRMPDGDWKKRVKAGQYGIRLDYSPVGPDTDPPVAGIVSAEEGTSVDFTGYTIEFLNPEIRPPWRSGKIGLGPKGNFMTIVSAEKGKANTFQIELRDGTGALQGLNPARFQITVKGTGQVQITLPHGVGVALANNEVMPFFERGVAIPSMKTKELHTAVAIQKGHDGQLLRVPIVEGDKSRADRNRLIGTLTIPANNISRDVPAGSSIEVTIQIDQSRLIRTSAFIPILDEDFTDILKLESATPDANELSVGLAKAKERLTEMREKAEKAGDERAAGAIRRVDAESMVPEAERMVAAAPGDTDAGRQCQNLLTRLESSLDEAEDAMEWPLLVADARTALEEARKLIVGDADAAEDDKREFATLEREINVAIEHRVPDLLRKRTEGVRSLGIGIELRKPGLWVAFFVNMKERKSEMRDTVMADRLFVQGDRAIEDGNVPMLRTAVQQLMQLLPVSARPAAMSDVAR